MSQEAMKSILMVTGMGLFMFGTVVLLTGFLPGMDSDGFHHQMSEGMLCMLLGITCAEKGM